MSVSPENTKWKQKRSRYRTSFEFGEEELTYIFDNSVTKAGSTVAYDKIPGRPIYRAIRMWWLKYVVVFYLTFCSITTFHYMGANDIELAYGILYAATLVLFVIVFVSFRRRHGSMISLPLNPMLYILHDDSQDSILDEILKRKRVMMRDKLAKIDSVRPYYEEASKFIWLKEEGIISEQEYRLARQKITAIRDKAVLSGPA